jgi:phosphoribosylglycinamide formyltransferase 1
MNLAIFASGRGSNFSAINKAIKQGKLKIKLCLLVCDQLKAPVIQRAMRAGVRVVLVRREDFIRRADFEAAIIGKLKELKIDLIALAGFMRLLSPEFVRRYRGRIINIHPSLLPAFKGAQAIQDAYSAGVEVTGVTIHFVDEQVDHGPVIMQQEVRIGPKDTVVSLEKKIHRLEHKLYPCAIKLFMSGKLRSMRVAKAA